MSGRPWCSIMESLEETSRKDTHTVFSNPKGQEGMFFRFVTTVGEGGGSSVFFLLFSWSRPLALAWGATIRKGLRQENLKGDAEPLFLLSLPRDRRRNERRARKKRKRRTLRTNRKRKRVKEEAEEG